MSITRLEFLFQRYLDNTCTVEEHRELMLLLQQSAYDTSAREMLDKVWNGLTIDHRLSVSKADAIFSNILASDIPAQQAPARSLPSKPVYRLYTRVAVAAAVLLAIATGAYFLLNRTSSHEATATGSHHFKNDIPPGRNNAILVLADGHKINLDSSGNGNIAREGNTTIRKQDGELSYSPSQAAGKEPETFNTVTTARGNQYRLVLPDGSRVWLNAESSIRFRPAFAGQERRVEMTGEAYFEVKHNDKIPFVVVVNGMEVHDQGTQFNINAYTNESLTNTTLVEGSVKVVKGANTSMLKPGQQAQVNGEGHIKLVKEADVEAATAWKNGQFMFQGNNIQSVMRQLERWYDIEVSYSGNVSKEEFVGAISRFQHISDVLMMLEKTRTVSFEINGRKVIVK